MEWNGITAFSVWAWSLLMYTLRTPSSPGVGSKAVALMTHAVGFDYSRPGHSAMTATYVWAWSRLMYTRRSPSPPGEYNKATRDLWLKPIYGNHG